MQHRHGRLEDRAAGDRLPDSCEFLARLLLQANSPAGCGAVAVTALATGYLAQTYGLRPAPFFLGIAFAAIGLGLSTLAVRETGTMPASRPPGTSPAPTAATTTSTDS